MLDKLHSILVFVRKHERVLSTLSISLKVCKLSKSGPRPTPSSKLSCTSLSRPCCDAVPSTEWLLRPFSFQIHGRFYTSCLDFEALEISGHSLWDLKLNGRKVLLLRFRAVGNLGGYCRVSIVINYNITVTVTQGCSQVSLAGQQEAASQKDKECLQLSFETRSLQALFFSVMHESYVERAGTRDLCKR